MKLVALLRYGWPAYYYWSGQMALAQPWEQGVLDLSGHRPGRTVTLPPGVAWDQVRPEDTSRLEEGEPGRGPYGPWNLRGVPYNGARAVLYLAQPDGSVRVVVARPLPAVGPALPDDQYPPWQWFAEFDFAQFSKEQLVSLLTTGECVWPGP